MCTALASATHWTHLNRIIVDVCTMTSPGFDRALTKKSAVAFLLNDWWPYITTTIHYTRMGVCVRRPLAIGSLGISGRGHTIKSITPPPINSIRFAITVIARSQILASWSSPSRWTHHQYCPCVHPSVRSSYIHHVIFSNMCGNAAYWFSIPWRIIYFYALSYVFQLNFIGFTGIDLLM